MLVLDVINIGRHVENIRKFQVYHSMDNFFQTNNEHIMYSINAMLQLLFFVSTNYEHIIIEIILYILFFLYVWL